MFFIIHFTEEKPTYNTNVDNILFQYCKYALYNDTGIYGIIRYDVLSVKLKKRQAVYSWRFFHFSARLRCRTCPEHVVLKVRRFKGKPSPVSQSRLYLSNNSALSRSLAKHSLEHTHTHTRTTTHTHTDTHTGKQSHTQSHTHMHTQPHKQTDTHTCSHTHKHTYRHTHTHTHT